MAVAHRYVEFKTGNICLGMYLPELWEGCTLIWEAVIIHNVPVKDIHFVCFHGIKCLQYGRQWEEVA
jgi:hypothetical protein